MTVGQTPPGWYDDGRGQLRYYDGNAWTEHVHPLPPPTPPAPPAPPAAPAAPPAAPAAPVAPVAAAAVPAAATLGGAPATRTVAAPAPAETPVYKKPWFIGVVVVALLAAAGAAYVLTQGGSDSTGTGAPSTTPSATASVGGGGTTGGTAYYGAEPSVVAAKAGCTVGVTIPVQTTPPTQGSLPKAATTCMLNGASYTVVTWTAAADQDNPASLANAFTAPITAGTKYYATGPGWTAFDPTYSQTSAQAFATAAGGTVKSVVVVTSSSSAPAP